MAKAVEALSEQLSALGVQQGDVLMLHASLRELGLARSQGVEHGATLLFDSLEQVLGPRGTLLMILGTDYPMDWVNLRPIEERAALLKNAPAFDFRSAPVLPEVGFIAEAFRQRSGTILSSNPSGRFAASGAQAEALLRDQPWNDYYGPGSPLERLCERGGKILRLGSNPETVTALHYAEYVANLPDKRRTRWDYVLERNGAPQHVWIECLNDSDGIFPWEGEDYFSLIVREYLAQGRHREGTVGTAKAELLEAAALVEFGARWMERNLRFTPSAGG